ncbi:MAG TPA: M14 family zinc carboxypeptidase [Nevskiaceae bacterium]|nr:M14 family zinc carboxypeptidase [Nevskiaceae bacterium]
MRRMALALLAVLPMVALASGDPEFDRESQIVDWLRSVRAAAPDARTRARVEALTHYESKATRPSPEPRNGDETVAAFNIASEARGTLRAWERNAELPPASIARVPTSKAATPGSIIHYVESASSGACTSDEVCTEIGVPVPMPVDSQTPVAGFRTYASLLAGLQALVAQNSDIASATTVGTTAANRNIVAFEIGAAGSPAFLQSGGIHAREWIAPEVVAGYLERLIGNRHDGGLYQYLIDNVKSVLIPVLNVDGFLQTQRFPDRAVASTCSEDASNEPRDGRMRRKNMSADGTLVDEILTTIADDMLGVDANRNNLPWWGGTPGSSGNPCSLVYRGAAAESTRELQALTAAAALAPASRLRLYIDTHSYTRAYLAADTGNARRDAIQQQLAQRMSAVAGGRYSYSASSPGHGIGSTDEHFANTYQIPAYTLEVEPTIAGGIADYGGIDVPDSGFILPSAEVPRVRDEMVSATVLGVYRQSGPPSVSDIVIFAGPDALGFQGMWLQSGNQRTFHVASPASLQAGGSYTLTVGFTKPMRVRDSAGEITQYPGQSVALDPTLALEGLDAQGQPFTVPIATTSGHWYGAHYVNDAYAVDFQIPAGTPIAGARRLSLAVTASDFSGNALDANPATPVDWSDGAWSGYEDATCASGDVGGTDRSARLIDDGSPLCAGAGGDGGGGAIDLASLIALLLLRRFRRS